MGSFGLWLALHVDDAHSRRPGFRVVGPGCLLSGPCRSDRGRAREAAECCAWPVCCVGSGFVIVLGDWIFFGIRFDVPVSDLTVATLVIMGLGAAVAQPTAILAAWMGNVARRVLPRDLCFTEVRRDLIGYIGHGLWPAGDEP